jgi:hypothetical protein
VDINDNGQIVGVGLHEGASRVYLLTPIPEPQSLVMAIAAWTTGVVVAAARYLFRSGGKIQR